MPADYDEYFTAFSDLVGTADSQPGYAGADDNIASVDSWIDMFESTGIDFDSHAQTVDAFENFVLAFYPQENMSGDDWYYVREEFYDMYGLSDRDIDWEAYREAIGYGRD